MENRIPNRTTNWRIAILVIGLVIVLAFWLLNFRAAVSNTDAQHNSVTTSIGERLPDAMQQREKITVVISGDGRLADVCEVHWQNRSTKPAWARSKWCGS